MSSRPAEESMTGLESTRPAEERSVGLLRWGKASAAFEYVEPAWLRTVTRNNWGTR